MARIYNSWIAAFSRLRKAGDVVHVKTATFDYVFTQNAENVTVTYQRYQRKGKERIRNADFLSISAKDGRFPNGRKT